MTALTIAQENGLDKTLRALVDAHNATDRLKGAHFAALRTAIDAAMAQCLDITQAHRLELDWWAEASTEDGAWSGCVAALDATEARAQVLALHGGDASEIEISVIGVA